MKFAFYISGNSGRLTKYLRYYNPDMDIAVVISDKEIGSDLSELIEGKGIDYKCFDYLGSGSTPAERNLALSDYMLDVFDNLSVDYMVSFGAHILRGDLLDSYRNRLINFHPAILPMFPGIRSIDQAVDYGNVFLVGNTAHFIDEEVDHGSIIMQSVIPLQGFLDSEGNYDLILDYQVEMLDKLLKVLEENRLKETGDRVIIQGADYTKGAIYPSV